MKTILKTLVGSKAHGLDRPDSDTDFRFVWLYPTSEILSLGFHGKGVAWEEGKGEDKAKIQDNTGHELLQFLQLACHSNPSVLETLVGPTIESTPEGEELKALFPYVWSSNDIFNACLGYSHNQRKKFIEDKDERPWKYAVAQIRTLLLGIELLKFGTMTVNVKEQENKLNINYASMSVEGTKDTLMGMKDGYFRQKGFVLDWASFLEKELKSAYDANPNKQTDYNKVNEFLLGIRKRNW